MKFNEKCNSTMSAILRLLFFRSTAWTLNTWSLMWATGYRPSGAAGGNSAKSTYSFRWIRSTSLLGIASIPSSIWRTGPALDVFDFVVLSGVVLPIAAYAPAVSSNAGTPCCWFHCDTIKCFRPWWYPCITSNHACITACLLLSYSH